MIFRWGGTRILPHFEVDLSPLATMRKKHRMSDRALVTPEEEIELVGCVGDG